MSALVPLGRKSIAMMKLGLFVSGPGHHVAAWRDPDVEPDAGQSLKHYIEIARLGERGRFDFLFNADSNSTFGPDDVNVWKRTIASLRLAGLPDPSMRVPLRMTSVLTAGFAAPIAITPAR